VVWVSYRYSTKSEKKLETCHPDIQRVFSIVIERSAIDISVTFGARTLKEQKRLYAIGRTKPGNKVTNCDGVKHKSKHQVKEDGFSHAIDLSIYCSDSNFSATTRYDPLHLAYIAGVVDSVVKELYLEGEITHEFIWGGNWDNDGVIKYDQKMQDLCHWEIRKK
jgi:peptidoglycan L-alanyl-D-glutamate endopeptidase CwlK